MYRILYVEVNFYQFVFFTAIVQSLVEHVITSAQICIDTVIISQSIRSIQKKEVNVVNLEVKHKSTICTVASIFCASCQKETYHIIMQHLHDLYIISILHDLLE